MGNVNTAISVSLNIIEGLRENFFPFNLDIFHYLISIIKKT